ncbi:MAG: type transport system ATP-binding protein [Thermococcaceae archaeon]|nr:type transport system ATP-binding protein [Thermococcaceae archaeon]
MNMIETRELTKVYGDTPVVDGLNLTVKKGTVFGFLGPNGAGKTTTILMLLGMIQPTKGEAYVNGINVQEKPVEVKRISGFMPGESNLYPNMSALDDTVRITGVSPPEAIQSHHQAVHQTENEF